MISIITPIYNFDKNQFKLSLDSIIKQTSKEFEWVIAIDGGQIAGDTVYTIQESGIKYKVVHTPENYGASVARNLAFQISDGDIITYLDCGDEISYNRVANLAEKFQTHEKLQLMFSPYIIVDEALGMKQNFNLSQYRVTFEAIKDILQKQNISIPLGVAHTRKAFVESGGFQRGIVCGEDGLLWRRICDDIDAENFLLDDVSAGVYYVSQTGQSRTQRRPDMGGFAFDGSKNDNGKYLDENWFNTYNSVNLFDRKE